MSTDTKEVLAFAETLMKEITKRDAQIVLYEHLVANQKAMIERLEYLLTVKPIPIVIREEL
jgi:hypothetical protein